ncbi:MAG: UDP-N-acetylglucosamine diphosphorylase/glucosamine-1-phosphate N-acetyltransferase [Candidatus Muproteobacteria bacterium RBG_16_60_9]|uniref:Bifunctional protein GlmU n=1 Tax=Candidatus Muproteobacteria bacterium RBG_16_60_9 TaxID=1817755 RepID=A0A1F6VKG5_9PROT|nr:MAG: UDP-N-acetylglucosamine diphosphorylase/glucosamine-1-phosphate N-acetyltransferase [Candidatus Muproteobacteria bacterium RBG_16_60_9]
MSNLEVIILAAGQGKRMHSDLPKVLHAIGGKPLLAHVIDVAGDLAPRAIRVVYGHGGEQVRSALAPAPVHWIHQAEQLGTGHAVQQAIAAVADDSTVLVLYGDVPLIRADTLRHLISPSPQPTLALLTMELPDPNGYGRIVRNSRGAVERIVEQKDASATEARLREINTGIMAAPARLLRRWLARLENSNSQREYYLTDIVGMAAAQDVAIVTHRPRAVWEILGVNSKRELADLERAHQRTVAQALLEKGVTLRDPERLDVRGELSCGRDVVIDVNVIFEGKVTLGDGVSIGPNNLIRDTEIRAGTQILANCVIEEAVIGAGARIGPFARLRPGNRLADRVHVGNFVEIKKSEIGEGSKANHLTYIGDSRVGRDVNVGAGTITANYDGANKNQTIIEDNVSIGSNVVLRAPVTVGDGATIGAGSVITKDAPAGELTLTRAEQKTVKGWKRPKKSGK